MSAEDVKVAEAFFACLQSGDVEGAAALVTDDVELVEAGGVPHAGTYRGREGFFELLGRMGSLLGGVELTDYTASDAGDFVVGRMTATFTAKAGDGRISMPVVELYRIRDGKLAHADIYYKDPSLFAGLDG